MTNQTIVRSLWVGWGNSVLYEITAGAPFSFSLSASPDFGQVEIVKDVGGNFSTNNVTVSGNGFNIDGLSTFLMNTNYMCSTFYFDGTSWNILTAGSSGGGGGTETGSVISTGGAKTIPPVVAGSPINRVVTTTDAVTFNIPSPNASAPWGRVNISDQSGNPNITISPASGLINGAASYTLLSAYESVDLLDFGTGWTIQ
jgi:hypothetical protein